MVQLRQDGLTWHVAGDEVVVLDLGGSVYLKLNGSGRVLWERLAEPCTEADLVAALIDAYDIDRTRAEADVTSFVADLRQRQLLEGVAVDRRAAALRRLRQRVGRVHRLPLRELLATLHALGVLVVVELLIRNVRLPRLARLLGVRLDLTPVHPAPGAVSLDLSPTSRRQLRATARVVDVWPFCHGPCLRQSLVAAHLLATRVRRSASASPAPAIELQAHAWVEVDGHPLEDVGEFAVLHSTPASSSIA